AVDGVVEAVVGLRCHAARLAGFELLHGRGRVGDDLEVDARGVHLLEAEIAEVVELVLEAGEAALGARAAGVGPDRLVGVVLFEGNHIRLRHGCERTPRLRATRYALLRRENPTGCVDDTPDLWRTRLSRGGHT